MKFWEWSLCSQRMPTTAFAASAEVSDHCRHGSDCWRPLCPYWRSGDGRAVKWAAIWSVLAVLKWHAEKLVWIQANETVRSALKIEVLQDPKV